MPINNITAKSMTALLWNANGLYQHRYELEYLLNEKRIDIAMITETHLTANTRFKINGYYIYRTDHPDNTGHGGTALLVKSSLKHISSPSFIQRDYLQTTTITIYLQNLNIDVSVLYCPPRFQMTQDMFVEAFNNLGAHFIVGGDFNSKHPLWGSRLINPRGRLLHSLIINKQYNTHAPPAPTYWPAARNRLPDVLDFFISRGINPYNVFTESLEELSSDHSPVLLTLQASPKYTQRPPSLTSQIIDWNSYREFINEHLNCHVPLKTDEDLDTAVEHFTTTIQTAAWTCSTPRKRSYDPRPLYPADLRMLIQEKRRARHLWQRTQMPADKANFSRLTNKLKKELQKFKVKQFDSYTATLSRNDNSIWKATKRLLKHPAIPSPLRRPDFSWAKTDEEKAEMFAQHLETVFQPHPDVKDPDFCVSVANHLSEPFQLSLPPTPFQKEEIHRTIQKLPANKAPGFDLITAKVLQELPPNGFKFLQFLFNAVLRVAYFPIQWKFATIIMFVKPGKPAHEVMSYRPISLLPVLGKVLERLLLPRILNFCALSKIIPDHQFGFRQNHSTIQQLHRVVDFIADSLEKRMFTVGVFLDISSAFDRVWHDGVLVKLKNVLPDTYYRLIRSFLKDRHFKVRQGDTLSSLHSTNAGVPQGAILSPLLYTIYTADMPNQNDVLLATYADDTAILSRSKSLAEAIRRAQAQLQSMEKWLKRWRIKVNPNKSIHITFSLRQGICPNLRLCGVDIPQENSVKYLGLRLDKRLTWSSHLKQKRLTLNNRLKQLYCLVNSRSSLPLRQKILIYNTILKPIWSYGIQIFGAAAKSNLKTIQAFQSKFLRLVTGAPYYVSNATLHNDMKIPTVQQLSKSLYNRFFYKLQHHSNILIRNMSDPQLLRLRRLRRSWSRDLLT